MRFFVSAVFLLLIIGFAFAPNDSDFGSGGHSNMTEGVTYIPAPPSTACNLSYRDEINVRALDGRMRPIEGARVRITYQIDKTTGKGYFTVPAKTTGKDGNVSFTITNRETVHSHLDCNVLVNLTVDGRNFSRLIIAESHPLSIDFILDVYSLRVLVVDGQNSAITGALVSINNVNKTTDFGIADFKVFTGITRVFVKYLEGKREEQVEVQNDTTATIQLIFYKLKIFTMDENENSLKTQIIIDEKEYETDEKGELTISQIVSPLHTAVVAYQGKEKVIELDLAEASDYYVSFDISPPKIKGVNVFEEGGKLRVVINAEDEGKSASGISISDVLVQYTTEAGGTKKASVYQGRPNQYVAELPVGENMAEVSFVISIRDKDGNRISAEVTYALSAVSPVNNASTAIPPGWQQKGDNITNGEQPSFIPDIGVPLHYVIGGIIILVVVFYAVYRLKFKKEG